jgi:hypothetical protein
MCIFLWTVGLVSYRLEDLKSGTIKVGTCSVHKAVSRLSPTHHFLASPQAYRVREVRERYDTATEREQYYEPSTLQLYHIRLDWINVTRGRCGWFDLRLVSQCTILLLEVYMK